MELICVYNISDKVEKRTDITDSYIDNINKIFVNLLGDREEGISGQARRYAIDPDLEMHKLLKLKRDYFNSQRTEELINFLDSFASDLLQAELVQGRKDGNKRRNKRIAQGTLLIKMLENKIILLKLLELDGIDKETFEIIGELGAVRNYYKAAIYSGKEINIVDKNKSKYWVEKFLNVQPVRDGLADTKVEIDNKKGTNVEDVINFIEDSKIFAEKSIDPKYKEMLLNLLEIT